MKIDGNKRKREFHGIYKHILSECRSRKRKNPSQLEFLYRKNVDFAYNKEIFFSKAIKALSYLEIVLDFNYNSIRENTIKTPILHEEREIWYLLQTPDLIA